MGLSVSVGDYSASLRDGDADWFKEQLDLVNKALRANGVSEHIEPEDVPELGYQSIVSS